MRQASATRQQYGRLQVRNGGRYGKQGWGDSRIGWGEINSDLKVGVDWNGGGGLADRELSVAAYRGGY